MSPFQVAITYNFDSAYTQVNFWSTVELCLQRGRKICRQTKYWDKVWPREMADLLIKSNIVK